MNDCKCDSLQRFENINKMHDIKDGLVSEMTTYFNLAIKHNIYPGDLSDAIANLLTSVKKLQHSVTRQVSKH